MHSHLILYFSTYFGINKVEYFYGFVLFIFFAIYSFVLYFFSRMNVMFDIERITLDQEKDINKRKLLKRRRENINKCMYYINDYFNSDQQKVYKWITTKNPNLGGITPYDMLESGKEEKLLEFIENQYYLSGKDLLD
jgi:hypothetical protein